jgi:hypothetical protein
MLQSTPLPEAIRSAALRQIAKGGYQSPKLDTFVLEAPGLEKPVALAGNFN